jgi:hypothetical protein
MKKLFFLLMAISVISSCSKDDDPVNPSVPVTPTTTTIDSLKLLGYSYEVGNTITNSGGSITVRFNHPVSCNSVKTDAKEATWKTANGDSALVISSPIEFNSEYNIELNMTDKTTGRSWPFTLTAKTFNGRYKYEGIVQSVIYDYERERIWMATILPNRLYSISMADPTKEVHKDFELCPNVLALNPYNDKLYVGFNIQYYDEAKLYDRKVHVLDPQTLKEESAFVVSLDGDEGVDDDGEKFMLPDATPRSMAFTNDGFGVIIRGHYGGSASELCYVDSKNGNKVTYDNENWDDYTGVVANYDQKSVNIYMANFDGPDFYTVSRSNPTPKYHVIKVPGGTVDYRHFHRSKPIYLVQRLGELCMMNYETNTYSPILGDYAHNDFGDFDYNKENCVVKATITYYQNGYEGYAYFIKYLDASKAEIKYAGKINPNGWRVQSIFMHPSRDLLAIFYVEDYDEDATTITTIDMKTIRH